MSRSPESIAAFICARMAYLHDENRVLSECMAKWPVIRVMVEPVAVVPTCATTDSPEPAVRRAPEKSAPAPPACGHVKGSRRPRPVADAHATHRSIVGIITPAQISDIGTHEGTRWADLSAFERVWKNLRENERQWR